MAYFRRTTMNTLRESLAEYVALRRAFGTKYLEPAQTLGYFVDYMEREGAQFITISLAMKWAMQPQGVQHATWARRLTMVRRFASWLSATEPQTQVPPPRLIASQRHRRAPYIFTDEEVCQLMGAASHLRSPKGLRAATYATLIGLYAATGLRPGEALALDRTDVDLQIGVLTIRQTKFGKSRLIPTTESTRTALKRYQQMSIEFDSRRQSEAFFISEHGTRLVSISVRRTFETISRSVGLRADVDNARVGRGPRLQDFRHSFATRTLIDWYKAGLDVTVELPKLATYLGHVDVGHTYWYIEGVPELLQLAAERLGTHVSRGRV
jgi:site-specific recombinase XerD